MKKRSRSYVSITLAAAMLTSVFVSFHINAGAASGVSYIDRSWNGASVAEEVKSCPSYSTIGSQNDLTIGNGGWYVVNGDATISNRVTVTGTANIILLSGTLTCSDGIRLSSGNTLNIYPGESSAGTLTAKIKGDDYANIGGNENETCGTLNFHGGTLNAENDGIWTYGAAIGGGEKGGAGNLSFYGGKVNAKNAGSSIAKCSTGAAIGSGGFEENKAPTGSVNIYGGEITASCYRYSTAAGIGGGEESKCPAVNILGGNVTARGSEGPGIGVGQEGISDTVTIRGAVVKAEGDLGAAIGGGEDCNAGNIIIESSIVTADVCVDGGGKSNEGAAIGGGNSGSSTYIKIDKSIVNAYAAKYGAGIGGGDEGSGGTIEITDSNVFACSGKGGAAIGGGDEKGCGSITIKRSYVTATTDSEINTAEKRFLESYGSSFDTIALYLAENPATSKEAAIYSAGTLVAMLIANLAEGTRTGAGIGSGHGGTADSILIEDSIVVATGGDCAAGIGGGISGSFGTIDIKNSKIHARSVTDGAGIGSGESGSCGTINITDDSIVVAEGGPYGAGIGGGDDSSGGTINITNSSVTAKGGTDGAGIGGGEGGNGGTITIKNSDVDARGGSYAAGIGGGDGGNGGTIKIDASKVTSNGGTDGAGIGGGEDGNGGHIEIINGSDVYAEGRDCGAGIGGGEDASGEYCLIGYGCNVHAVAGRGNAQAIGHGDCGWYVVKYTGGTLALNTSLKVRVNNVWFWGDDRFKAARKHNDVHLYTCEHTLVCRAENARTHGMRCTECGTKVGTTSEHRLNSEGVCIDCGAGKDSFIVKYIEKRSDGSEFEKSESMPSKAEFIVPECSSSPDGFGFKCWKDSNGRFWVPGQDYSQYTTDSITFTAQYLELTQTTYIDEEGREETVQARRLTPDKLDNNLFLDSGWYVIEGSATVTASADYVNRTICARDGVNLILADGCYLRIISSVNGEVGTNGNSADSLTLYGQREQTGGIDIQNGGMFLKNLFVYGGSLNINCNNYEEKLEVTGMLQIERGEINCSNSKINSLCYRGGHFTATGGLEVNECEPFRWESYGDDYLAFKIKGDYTGYSVADGYAFKDNQNDITYKGSFSSEDIERLRSETCRLRPAYMHEYDAVAWDWSEDYKEATVTLKCKDCSDVQQLKTKQIKVERGNRITVIDTNLEYMGKNYNKVEEIPTEYKVTVHAGKGGNVAVDKETAQYFDTVTITPTPDDNYLIKTVTAKNSEGDELVVNNMRDGTYTFTIEDDDVDVYVEFIEGEYRPEEDPYFDKDGKYVPGCRAHYEAADGSCYEIKSDGTPDYSYVYQRDHFLKSDFKFVEQEDGTYRISKYTGTVSDNMTLVIPDTYQGKKVTVLGGGDPTAYGKYLFDSNNNSVKVVLNGNIRELKEGVFRYVTLSELSGDTSGLNKIAATAFPAWLTSSAKRDIYLDYKGEIEITGEESLNSFRSFKNSIIHLSHATTFKNVDETTIDSSTVFDFTDAHIYGEPEWIWAEDNSSAKAKFTCTDSRCRHEELIDAALTSAVGEDKIVRTASVGLDGKTYTDSKEIERKLYEIAIEECVHGTITADKAAAYEGEVITLTAEPAGGYSLSEISVKDEQGNDITVTESSFVMPAVNITVSAVFAERALNIHVGGVGITWNNCSDILGDGTASYDFATNTLTLTDAEIEIAQRSGVRSGIRYNEVSDKPFNIVLNGNNKIVDKIDNGTSDIFGIALYAAAPGFTVSGGGTLDIELDPNQKGVGIHVRKALTLSNTTVTVNAANTGDLAAVDLCYSDTYLILTDGARMFIRSGNTALASNRSNIQNLHIADGCILEAVSDTQAFNGNINLTDEHPDVRVNTAASSDGSKLWDGSSSPLTDYKYIRIQSNNVMYSIVIGDTQYGTVTADRATAYEGGKVTLTAAPEEGSALESLSVKDEGGNEITVTDNSFVMPNSNVTVTAKFTAPPVKEPTASAQLVNDYTGTYDVASLWQFTVTPGTNAVESLGAKINGAATDTLSVGQITDATIVFGVVVDIQSKDITSKAAVVNGDEITVE